VPERLGEDRVLCRGAHRDADRPGGAEAAARPDDHALPKELLEDLPPINHLGEEEVAERRPHRIEAVLAEDAFELLAPDGSTWRYGPPDADSTITSKAVMAMAEKFNTGQEVCLKIPSARGVMQVKEGTSGSIASR